MLTYSEAFQKLKEVQFYWGEEGISLGQAVGRVLAEGVRSDRAYPPFHRAAMDGWAVRSIDFTSGIRDGFKIKGKCLAGEPESTLDFQALDTLQIMTGAPVPPFFDSIIRVEDQEKIENGNVFLKPIAFKPGQNIAKRGEDLQQGVDVLPAGHVIAAADVATLASLGKHEVRVKRLPSINIYSTGNEIVPIHSIPLPHQIRDSNSHALMALFRTQGIPTEFKGILPDEPGVLKETLAIEKADICILTGGVSAGDADWLPQVLQEIGVEKVFHKVKIKPGKPIWVGKKENQLFFALPGNPLSCQVAFVLFIWPWLRYNWGLESHVWQQLPMASSRTKKVALDEFFPVYIKNGQVFPRPIRGSGDITATLGTQGIGWHPLEKDELPIGEGVSFLPW